MTVRFTCPRSDAIPLRQDTVVWARHGIVGGTAARAWGAYTLGGERYAWTIAHGSSCDPRQDVDALAQALSDDHLAIVTLAAGSDFTSQDVAQAIADELDAAFGHSPSVDSTTVDGQTRYRVTVAGASAGAVGEPSSSKGVTSQCGIHDGSRRDGDGAVTGTLWIHTEVRAYNRDGTAVPDGTRARITGVGYFGSDAFRPRLGVGLGPAHSLTPANIGPVVDAGRPASGSSNGYDPIVIPLPVAIPCVVGDDAWIAVCDAGSPGTLHYRFLASSGWHGDLDTSENLIVEATRNDPDAAFPGGTITPTISANFAVHSMAFVIVECDDPGADDGSGFAGDGSIWCEIGCRRDAAGETPTEDAPDGETFHYRMLTPPFSRAAFAQVGYGLAAVDAAEDMSCAFYSWDVLDLAGAVATRLGTSGGRLGWDDGTPDAYNITTLPARVACGDDVVSDPYVSFGFTGGRIVGGAPTVMQIQFDTREGGGPDFGVDGEQLYNQGASPDLLVSDWVVGGLRALAEYQSAPTSSMPYNAPAGSWPSSYDFAGTNARPGNLGRADAVIAEQSATADVFAAESVVDGTTWSAGTALDLAADAATILLATWSAGIALGLAASGSVQAFGTWTAGTALALRAGASLAGVVSLGGEVVPMPDMLEILKSGSARDGVTPTNVSMTASAVRISPVPATAKGSLLIGGCITAAEATSVTFYDGDPGSGGVALFVQPLAANVPFPLAIGAIYSSGGRAVYLSPSGSVAVTGRSIASEI